MHTTGVLMSCKSGRAVYTFRLDGVSSLGAFRVPFFLVEFVAAVHVYQNHVRLHTRDINIPVSNAVTSALFWVLICKPIITQNLVSDYVMVMHSLLQWFSHLLMLRTQVG